jgi:hypothetical protein
MNPPVIHPIVNGGPAYCGHPKGYANRQKVGFLPTTLTEKSSHDHTAIRAARARAEHKSQFDGDPDKLKAKCLNLY